MTGGAILLAIWSGTSVFAQGIVNGDEEAGFDATVSLGVDIEGFATMSVCTGSLITPRVVLTAAHCSSDIPIEYIVAVGEVVFGPSITHPDEGVAIADAVIHPNYVALSNGGYPNSAGGYDSLGENDVALIELVEPVDVEPVWFRVAPLDSSVEGETVTSVGFGVTGASMGDNGIKRSAELVIDELSDTFIVSMSDENVNLANVCSGDSGGPQYHDEGDKWIQWAVHSWADSNCTSMSGSTRTDGVAEWILDELEFIHGTRDRCEMWGVYGDGACDTDCDEPDPDCEVDAADTGGESDIDDPADESGSPAEPGGATLGDEADGKGCACASRSGAGGMFWWVLSLAFVTTRRLIRV